MSKYFNIEEDVPLGPLTTLGVGGLARFFLRAETEEQVIDGFAFARQNELPVFVLGGGNNILVSDKGFDGLVIQINLKGLEGGVTTTVAAGEDWDSFVEHCVNNNLAGVECLSGIPGTVGGTPVQNVGAYGQEVSETIVLVRCYDRVADEIVSLE
ncbi:MAG TPA: FAD-binding protein, partial [Pyrinomonadaceae bacterium]|nr:FAD-binding protein [Pyrinomonadaceae bacterium]